MELSDPEKLILMMLCEIHAALKIQGGIDPKFVREAISTGNTWALKSEFPGIFEGGEAKEEVIKEVFDILDMWSFIEGSYSRFGKTDKDKVKTEATPFGADVRFRGFDANNEGDHLSVATFLIEQMHRYSVFHGRNLNSHGSPPLEALKRMLGAFDPMRNSLNGGELDADQVITLLKAQTHPSHR